MASSHLVEKTSFASQHKLASNFVALWFSCITFIGRLISIIYPQASVMSQMALSQSYGPSLDKVTIYDIDNID